jgi:hypothetical protein
MNTKELRNKVLSAIESANLTAEILNSYRNEGMHKNCLNCISFEEKREICVVAKQRPPVRVIAYGCPQFIDKDEIPF